MIICLSKISVTATVTIYVANICRCRNIYMHYIAWIFFQATVLNAALKEELQLTEQCLIHIDNNDRLTQIIENGVAEIKMAYPNVSNKMHQLIKDYKQISSCLNDGTFISQKSLYNTIDDLKCIDYDMDTLWL